MISLLTMCILAQLGTPSVESTSLATLQLLARADSVAKEADTDVVVVFDSTRVDVEENGRSHFQHHRLIKPYTEEAARQLQVIRLDYDPLANDNVITRLKIHRPDSTTESIPVNQYVDVEAPASGIYWGGRMRLYLTGKLNRGDALEYTTYRVGFQIAYLQQQQTTNRFVPPQEGEFYDVVVFGEEHPVLDRTYRLFLPRDKPVQFQEYNGEIESSVRFKDETLVYSWWKRDIPALADEPWSADHSDFLPKVVLATLEDWPARARWFFETNDSVLEPTEEISAKAAEVVQGLRSDEERFLALQQWVATHIRYSGVSMGEGEGYTIHPADMIFTERSGVCKDIAGMLIAMLRGIGYEVYPVMTMAGARVEDVPADQFNHCVVAVRQPDGSFYMLDPTWCSYSRHPWSRAEGHQNYVIGSPAGEELMQHPLFEEDNRIAWRMESSLTKTGDLVGTLRFEPSGYYDTRMRRRIIYRRPSERDALYVSYLRGLGPAVEIANAQYSDPDDLNTAFSLEIAFRVPGYAQIGEETMEFTSPLLTILTEGARLASPVRYEKEGDRKNPAMIWYSRWEEAEEVLKLPKGYRFADRDTLTAEKDEGAVFIQAAVEVQERRLITTFEGRLKDRYLKPEEFQRIHDASLELKDLASNVLVGERGGRG